MSCDIFRVMECHVMVLVCHGVSCDVLDGCHKSSCDVVFLSHDILWSFVVSRGKSYDVMCFRLVFHRISHDIMWFRLVFPQNITWHHVSWHAFTIGHHMTSCFVLWSFHSNNNNKGITVCPDTIQNRFVCPDMQPYLNHNIQNCLHVQTQPCLSRHYPKLFCLSRHVTLSKPMLTWSCLSRHNPKLSVQTCNPI